MGWFWADQTPAEVKRSGCQYISLSAGQELPAGYSIHPSSPNRLKSTIATPAPTTSGCPVPHGQRPATATAAVPPSSCPVSHEQSAFNAAQEPKSILSQLNPLNYMFRDLSQKPAPNQNFALPTSREESTIPKGDGGGTWEYPSPQQMYNALLRKGYTDTDITAVEPMVSVHNFLNEGAWAEIVGWEQRFSRGLYTGWQMCRRGEAHFDDELERYWDGNQPEPSLVRFQGRPKDMTPKAAMIQLFGRIYPSKFGTEPPFDRHDWYVSRVVNGEQKQIRYVIDYYSGEPDPDGEPVFYLDVRPAATPLGAAERMIRWGSDIWWRAMGGDVREQDTQSFVPYNPAQSSN